MSITKQAQRGYRCPACDRYSQGKLSQLMRIPHAATRAGIPIRMIRNAIERQDLDVVRIDEYPFIRESDLVEFVQTLRKGERDERHI